MRATVGAVAPLVGAQRSCSILRMVSSRRGTGPRLWPPRPAERYGPGGPSCRRRRPRTLDDRHARRNTGCLVAARLRASLAAIAAAAVLPAAAAAAPGAPLGQRL